MKAKASTIKTLSAVFAATIIIPGIIVAISISSFWVFLVAAAVAAFDLLIAFSFADLLVIAEDTNNRIRNLQLNNAPQAKPSVTAAPIVHTQTPAPKSEQKPASGRIVCPECATSQPGNRNVCYNCGAALKH